MRSISIIRLGLGLLAGGVFTIGVVNAVNGTKLIETGTSTFTATTFDYLVFESSPAQVAEIEKQDFVNSVFPCMSFSSAISPVHQATGITVFATPDYANVDISFFNAGRLTKGQDIASGIKLDEKAAAKLNLTIGNSVNLILGNTSFALPISGIYREVTYRGLDSGVALIQLTPEIEKGFASPLRKYDVSFVSASDVNALATYLQDYIPRARFLSRDEYGATLQRPTGLTDAEWEETIDNEYASYQSKYDSVDRGNVVQKKADYLSESQDSLTGVASALTRHHILYAIFVPVGFALLYAITIFMGRGKDEEEIRNGIGGVTKAAFITNQLIYYCGASLIGIGVPLAVGYIAASVNTVAVGAIPLLYSLPLLATTLVIVPLIFIYAKMIFGALKEPAQVIIMPREEDPTTPHVPVAHLQKEVGSAGEIAKIPPADFKLKQTVYFDDNGKTIVGKIVEFRGSFVMVKSKDFEEKYRVFPLEYARTHFHIQEEKKQ